MEQDPNGTNKTRGEEHIKDPELRRLYAQAMQVAAYHYNKLLKAKEHGKNDDPSN